MNAVYLDENGDEKPTYMGCYGIGVGRTAAAAIEQNHDDKGIIWPLPIAPFHVHVIPLSSDEEVMSVANEIYNKLSGLNIDVLIDDRDERAGVKFADADLIGIPYRIVIGKKGLKDGTVEFRSRVGNEIGRFSQEDVLDRVSKTVIDELANS